MARIRTVKPDFFKHEVLSKMSPMHRVLFAGLWCQADRDGRLADRPERLKREILPHDRCDLNQLLNDLAAAIDPYDNKPFILRYEANSVRYIQVVNFDKHQCPNVKEPKSIIPAPCQNGAKT